MLARVTIIMLIGLAQSLMAVDQTVAKAIEKLVPSYVQIMGGSGVVISADGLMLTNHHVINSAYRQDRRTYPVRVGSQRYQANLLGTDPHGDIALLRIDLDDGITLPFVEFADSETLKVGQSVIAIGNPFGAMGAVGDPTVTLGVISLLHFNRGSYSDSIMTDAPINPGNSGGPLLTLDGTLAGINGAINSKTGSRSNTGIGMAIPANQIKRFLPWMKKAKGKFVTHGRLRGLTFDTEEADGLFNGAEIKEVAEDTEAQRAGLASGDRIVAIDDMPIHNHNRFSGYLHTYPSSATVELSYIRNERKKTAKVKLEPLVNGTLGFDVNVPKKPRELQKLMRKIMSNPRMSRPITITNVHKGSNAAKAKLKKGDVIVKFFNRDVPNQAHMTRIMQILSRMRRCYPGDTIPMVVKRKSKTIKVDLVLSMPDKEKFAW